MIFKICRYIRQKAEIPGVSRRLGAYVSSHRYQSAAFAAIAVFLFGMAPMFMFWRTLGESYQGEKGWLYYQAAIWGDGLFLPILIGAAFLFTLFGADLTKGQKLVSAVVGLLCAVVGFRIQSTWIGMPALEIPNWTFKIVDGILTFNEAGWYHAVYFVVMFGLIGACMSMLACSKYSNRHKRESIIRVTAYALVWFAGAGYLFLHILDDYLEIFTSATKLTGIICLILLIAIIFSRCTGEARQLDGNALTRILILILPHPRDIQSILSGVFFAFGIDMLIAESVDKLAHGFSFTYAVMYAFFAVAFIYPNLHRVSVVIINALLVMLPAFGVGIYISAISNPLLSIAAIFVGSMMLCFIAGLQNVEFIEADYALFYDGEDIEITPKSIQWQEYIYALILMPIIGVFTFVSSNDITPVVSKTVNNIIFSDLILYISVLMPCCWRIKQLFQIVKDSEYKDRKRLADMDKDVQKSAKIGVYLYISFICIGFFLFILSALFQIENPFMKENWSMPSLSTRSLILFGISIVVCILIFILNRLPERVKHPLSVFLLVIAYISTILFVCDLRGPFLTFWGDMLLVFVAIGTALFIANGFISNMRLVRGVAMRRNTIDYRQIQVMKIIIFLGVTAVVLASTLPTEGEAGKYYPSLFSPLIGMVGTAFAAIAYPVLAARSIDLKEELPEPQVLQLKPLGGVAQDGVNGWLMIVFGGIFVLYYLASAEEDLISQILSLANIIITFGFIVLYTLRNNKWHYIEMTSDRFDTARDQVQLKWYPCQDFFSEFHNEPYISIQGIISLKSSVLPCSRRCQEKGGDFRSPENTTRP